MRVQSCPNSINAQKLGRTRVETQRLQQLQHPQQHQLQRQQHYHQQQYHHQQAFATGITEFDTAMATDPVWSNLVELDELIVVNVVDNETEGISSACACCNINNEDRDATYRSEFSRGIQDFVAGKRKRLDIQQMLFAGHGLSLVLKGRVGDKFHNLLFDSGPNEELWAMNWNKLKLTEDVDTLDAAVLSHWHPDHSRGLSAVARAMGSSEGEREEPFLFDLHPDKPHLRGIQLPNGSAFVPFNQDVSLSELDVAGCRTELNGEAHTLLDSFFYISGPIPRKTSYELGLPSHGTQRQEGGPWELDPLIMDERYVAARIKGRGVVVFSACSHAGIVNVCQDVSTVSGGEPLLAVMGGFHLAGRECEPRIPQTITDLRKLSPSLVIPGHCTGWRAKYALASAFTDRFQPLVVGGTYSFEARDDESVDRG